MSWVERIQNDLVITTGDGQQYRPQWMNAQKAQEFNIAEFEFIDVAGTLVNRSQPKANRYSLEIHFRGEDNLDERDAFQASSADPRAWVISHPFYGQITCQPISLSFDNSLYNLTTVTGTVVETITLSGPVVTANPVDKIAADKDAVDLAIAAAFAVGPAPGTDEITSLTDSTQTAYTQGSAAVKTTEDNEAYFNLFNEATAAIGAATSDPLLAMRATQALLNYPAQFSDNVTTRLNTLQDQFDKLSETLSNYDTPSLKIGYEGQASAIIGAMTVAASTPATGNYFNRGQVLIVINQLISVYNNYVIYIDSLQSTNGGSPSSYIPNSLGLQNLSDLVKYTVSVLFTIAQGAKQERSIVLEYDSNALLLTHRFYGLNDTGTNFDIFTDTNNIGINEILQIKKGRVILYYV
jgi:hypothetical protein